MPAALPFATPGQRIGLLGGSFDPPHAGHVHITRWALRALGLDQLWWLVSPGNPLKHRGPAPLETRLAAARDLMRHPRVSITDVERQFRTRYTADTLQQLQERHKGVHFVWLMGADNLVDLHLWERWEWIVENVPIGVLARPREQLRAGLSPAAQRYARWRRPAEMARGLGLRSKGVNGAGIRPAPDWVLLTGPMSPLSSTMLRNGE